MDRMTSRSRYSILSLIINTSFYNKWYCALAYFCERLNVWLQYWAILTTHMPDALASK